MVQGIKKNDEVLSDEGLEKGKFMTWSQRQQRQIEKYSMRQF